MSAASGIEITDDVVNTYNEMQLKHKYSYILFKISDDLKRVEVAKEGEGDDKMMITGKTNDDNYFQEFVEKLPKDDCRYGAIDIKFDTGGSGKREKICFIVWCPESAKIRNKMVYASTKDSLKKKLVGLAAEFQADCLSDMKYSDVLDKVMKAK